MAASGVLNSPTTKCRRRVQLVAVIAVFEENFEEHEVNLEVPYEHFEALVPHLQPTKES